MRTSPHFDEFPFWKVVFSVALGVLLANAVMWGAAAIMARVALQQAAEDAASSPAPTWLTLRMS
ncbi:MAG: hypothetical protein KDJ14_08695 [Xanthomonadales bacterium]|nr:hypothetical protein [Xanthomonadales bacterium]